MRPTNYSEEVLAKAEDYLENYQEKYDDIIPTVVGLCKAINRSKAIVYDWAKQKDKVEFSDILCQISEAQEGKLIKGGLTSDFNPAITKMLLAKHGYSDKVEQDHKSSDGSMSPTIVERVVVDNETTD